MAVLEDVKFICINVRGCLRQSGQTKSFEPILSTIKITLPFTEFSAITSQMTTSLGTMSMSWFAELEEARRSLTSCIVWP